MTTVQDARELHRILDSLVNAWCDRRLLKALATLLPAYSMPMGLSDDWARLYESLRSTRASCRDELPTMELEQVDAAISFVNQTLNRTPTRR